MRYALVVLSWLLTDRCNTMHKIQQNLSRGHINMCRCSTAATSRKQPCTGLSGSGTNREVRSSCLCKYVTGKVDQDVNRCGTCADRSSYLGYVTVHPGSPPAIEIRPGKDNHNAGPKTRQAKQRGKEIPDSSEHDPYPSQLSCSPY